MPTESSSLQYEYDTLRSQTTRFKHAYQEAITTGNLAEAKKQLALLQQNRDILMEKLWPFTELPQQELKQQYQRQKQTLEHLGILHTLSTGERGITAIHGTEYAYPSYADVAKQMREQKNILKPKIEQGFTPLLITPFGMKLDDLIEIYKQVIRKHHKEGKLLATKQHPTDPDEHLELDETNPLYVWDQYHDADTTGNLLYEVKAFSSDPTIHQGKTKSQILTDTHQGFHISLIEDVPNIPRVGQGRILGGRPQLEAGKTPRDYLSLLGTSPYDHEIGMTPEDQLMYAILHLEHTNKVIDDYQGHGSLSYQIGAYFFSSGVVPCASWNRDDRQAGMGGTRPNYRGGRCGVRSAVRVGDF